MSYHIAYLQSNLPGPGVTWHLHRLHQALLSITNHHPTVNREQEKRGWGEQEFWIIDIQDLCIIEACVYGYGYSYVLWHRDCGSPTLSVKPSHCLSLHTINASWSWKGGRGATSKSREALTASLVSSRKEPERGHVHPEGPPQCLAFYLILVHSLIFLQRSLSTV